MADLSNITALSGLTITSDQTTGTNNPNATFAFPNVTTTQRDLLQKDRKSTRLNSSHIPLSRMPSSA